MEKLCQLANIYHTHILNTLYKLVLEGKALNKENYVHKSEAQEIGWINKHWQKRVTAHLILQINDLKSEQKTYVTGHFFKFVFINHPVYYIIL